jgi:predicted aspartyl protease/Flp pilus assembly protein TadD
MRAGYRLLAGGIAVVVMSVMLHAQFQGIAEDADPVEAQLESADRLFVEGQFRQALDVYQRAEALAEGFLKVRANAGVARSALRIAEFRLAHVHALAAHEASPRDSTLLALYGDSLHSVGLFQEAEQRFRDAVEIDREQSRARHGLARALAGRMQLDEAMAEAEAALALAPEDPEINFLLGSLYERKRQYPEAVKFFSNYIEGLPQKDMSPMAVWARSEIAFLRSFGKRVSTRMRPGAESKRHTVPFRLVKGKVVVKGRLNGRPVEMIVDTGAEHTVISDRTARDVGLRPVVWSLSAGVGEHGFRGLQVGRLDALQIGSLKVENVRCLVKRPALRGLPAPEPESFSPLSLGLSVVIDYGRRQLSLGPIEEAKGGIELPMHFNRLATVRGMVNDEPAAFVVDTGGEIVSVSSAAAVGVPEPVGRRINVKVYGLSGWDTSAYLLRGVRLGFGDIMLDKQSFVVLDLEAPSILLGYELGGILGHKLLGRHRVEMDLERSLLRLAPL